MISVLDIDEAGFDAERVKEEWEAEFQQMFNGPLVLAKNIMGLLSATPEEREALLTQGGPNVERMVKHVDRMRGYMSHG